MKKLIFGSIVWSGCVYGAWVIFGWLTVTAPHQVRNWMNGSRHVLDVSADALGERAVAAETGLRAWINIDQVVTVGEITLLLYLGIRCLFWFLRRIAR